MKKILKLALLAPAAFALLVFAVANRHYVKVSLDPFGAADSTALSVAVPLFIVVIVSAMAGVLIGGLVSWFNHGKYRKAARSSRAEAERARAETALLRTRSADTAP